MLIVDLPTAGGPKINKAWQCHVTGETHGVMVDKCCERLRSFQKKLVDFTSSKKIRKLVSETDCDRLAFGLSGRLKPYPSFVILVLSKNQLQFSIYLFMRPPSIPKMSTPAAIGPKQLRAIK